MILFTLSALALATPTHAQIEAASWSQVSTRNTDGGPVLVFSATVGGQSCFRGTATTPVPVPKLLEVAIDIPSALRWSTAGLTKSEVLAKSGNSIEYWQYLDVPGWTLSADRYWFLRSTISSDPADSWEKWDMLPAGGAHAAKYAEVKAAYPDAVEPTMNIGEWRFKADGSGGSSVEYLICTNPGGSIPVAIQNAAEQKTLPDTVADLIREGRKRAGL
jgi:hypothetical protein